MRLSKSIFIITIVILSCLFCSCITGGNGLRVEISPSDKNLNELASKIYEDSQLSEIIKFDGQIRELDTRYPIECIRKYNKNYRVSYLGAEKIAVIIFDDSGNKVSGSIYNACKSKSDFSVLAKGESLKNVQKIDPYGEYLFLYTGRNDTPKISSHYTKDGYLITIQYNDSNTIINIKEEQI